MEQAVIGPAGARRDEDIALDLLKFVAGAAGVGRAATPAAGFVPSSGARQEDQVKQLLDLYSKCLGAIRSRG